MRRSRIIRTAIAALALIGLSLVGAAPQRAGAAEGDGAAAVIRSARRGAWSDPNTWAGGKVPGPAARVLICTGHRVVYDVESAVPIRAVNISGTLRFATDRDTRLDVGLIKIEAGDKYSEEGFDCDVHLQPPGENQERPALDVGSPNDPIAAEHTAIIRLVYFDGMDRQSCPAIVCCGGRMDFRGAPMNRTWLKLGKDAKARRPRDFAGRADCRMAHGRPHPRHRQRTGRQRVGHSPARQTPSKSLYRRTDAAIDRRHPADARSAAGIRPFRQRRFSRRSGRSEPQRRRRIGRSAGQRGHTMYHRYSTGTIRYAEFRHLGKEGVLGRYPIHFHLVGDTMRGSSVVGASIWDSGNRWLTIHGTDYLVVRDCVGYQSVGHGFFLEDGTEAYNVLDRNLAVQAYQGKPLPKQALPFDANEGAGFWWANCRNSFTRNVACENDRYGFRFEATKGSSFNPVLPVLQPDGSRKQTDLRTLPFIRFDDNEAHCDGLYGFNLGEGVDRVGPDVRHPLIIRRMKIWAVHYAFRPESPCVLVDGMQIDRAVYGVYHPNYDNHVYRNLTINGDGSEPFNRGLDDDSIQYGPLTVDGLTFTHVRGYPYSIPLIQISDDNPTGKAVSHFRNLKVLRADPTDRRPVVDTGGGAHVTPDTRHGVPVYLHDYFGPDRDAKIEATDAKDFGADALKYRAETPLTGHEARVTEVHAGEFPKLLDPVDDLPPTTVVTDVRRQSGNRLMVRGTTAAAGTIRRVLVNGKPARASDENFSQWEVELDGLPAGKVKLEAHAEDTAGNIEPRPHRL